MSKKTLNTFLKPLLATFTTFAAIHVAILILLVLVTGRIDFLNVFYIVGLQYFIPNIDKGILSQILSAFITIAIYLFFVFKLKKE